MLDPSRTSGRSRPLSTCRVVILADSLEEELVDGRCRVFVDRDGEISQVPPTCPRSWLKQRLFRPLLVQACSSSMASNSIVDGYRA